MTVQDHVFAHPVIVEEAIGRLGVRKGLAGRRALAHRTGHALEQLAQAMIQPYVRKRAPRQLCLEPFTALRPIVRCSATRPSPQNVPRQSAPIDSFVINPKSQALLITATTSSVIVSHTG